MSGSVIRRSARVIGMVSLAVGATLAGGARVEAGQASTLVGVVSCDAATGAQVVTWTFTFNYPSAPGSVVSAVVDASGLTAGTTIDTTATMSPSSGLNTLDTSVGVTRATGNAVGDYHLVLTYAPFDTANQILNGEVVLPGGCIESTSVPVTSAPTTTAASTTVATTAGSTIPAGATSTEVAGAGGLPGTGGTSPALPIIGAVLIALGGVLLVARRRGLDTRA